MRLSSFAWNRLLETQRNSRNELQSVRDFLRYAMTAFAEARIYCGHGTDNYWDEAVQLVMRALKLPLENNKVFLDARLTLDERHRMLSLIDRRTRERTPLAYLLNEAWFMGLPFFVDERVLVPRSPIAELLETGLQPWLGDRPVNRILDLCTGSGCIGIAAAYVFPEARVDLADLSTDALNVARRNIEDHGMSARVTAIESDLFAALEPGYDVILCNPPYVDAEDMARLQAEYRAEPELGLAAGPDGLDLVRRLLADAPRYLRQDGLLVVEVGNSWPALEQAYPQQSFTWLEFDKGGDGVFVMTGEELTGLAGN